MNERQKNTLDARCAIDHAALVEHQIAAVRDGNPDSARFAALAESSKNSKRKELFARAAVAAKQMETTLGSFIEIEAKETERTTAAKRALTIARAKAAAKPTGPLTREQANAAYAKLTSSAERDKFRAENKTLLGL